MEVQRITGPEAGVLKYDLLTALSVAGMNGSPTFQTSMLRLIALVTARYNWRADEISMGQRDMARMWSVNERTAKREIKRLTEAGVLIRKRGGVRGRVGAYALNFREIAKMSEGCWPLVGPDFEQRMRSRYRETEVKVVQMSAFAKTTGVPEIEQTDRSGTWAHVLSELAAADPDRFEAWFGRLTFHKIEHGDLYLTAPTKFVQRYIETQLMGFMLPLVEKVLGPINRVIFQN